MIFLLLGIYIGIALALLGIGAASGTDEPHWWLGALIWPVLVVWAIADRVRE